MCDTCYVGHHEECWNRNGRCSTFRCAGSPRLLLGSEYAMALDLALETANSEPRACPLCGQRAYGGQLYVRKAAQGGHPVGTQLEFIARNRAGSERRGPVKRIVDRVLNKSHWTLLGGQLRCRSCGSCRVLFLWGQVVDEAYLANAREQARDRFCVFCGTPMWAGDIRLADAKFWSDSVPDFHREWLLHHLLDRFVYNRWQLKLKMLPASSCPQCHYTEVFGRPVYRFS